MQQVSLNQQAADAALHLAVRLFDRGASVVLFQIHEDAAISRHQLEASHLVPVRLGLYNIHIEDMTSALRAAETAGIDLAINVFSALNTELGGKHRIILNVQLTRVGRDFTEVVAELLALTDFAIDHGHTVLFVQLSGVEDKFEPEH